MQRVHDDAVAYHQRADRRAIACALDEVAFPVAEHGAGGYTTLAGSGVYLESTPPVTETAFQVRIGVVPDTN